MARLPLQRILDYLRRREDHSSARSAFSYRCAFILIHRRSNGEPEARLESTFHKFSKTRYARKLSAEVEQRKEYLKRPEPKTFLDVAWQHYLSTGDLRPVLEHWTPAPAKKPPVSVRALPDSRKRRA